MKALSALFLILYASVAQSHEHEVTPTDDLLDPFTLEVISSDTNFDWSKLQLNESKVKFKKVTPNGAQSDSIPSHCRGLTIQRRLMAARGSLEQISQDLKKYFLECEAYLTRNNKKGLTALLDYAAIQYEVDYDKDDILDLQNISVAQYNRLSKQEQKNHIRQFKIKTPQNEELVGIMARTPNQIRPWVIVKCGIFCDSNPSASIKNMLLHLYEEGPFNVIVLSNQSALSNILTNKRVNFGGFYEGQELHAVAQWLKYESPFQHEVAAIHVLGISLGGSASLYAALFNDHNLVNNEKVINSVIAYCPVVNMKPTMEDVFRTTAKGLIFSAKSWQVLKKAAKVVPEVRAAINPNIPPPIADYVRILGEINSSFLNQKNPDNFLNPFQIIRNTISPNDYWFLNEFVAHAQGIQTPTLVFASKNDWVVDNTVNAATLEEMYNSDSNTQIKTINVSYGTHCAKSISYGWQAIGSILRGYFLSQTPEQKFSSHEELSSIEIKPLPISKDQIITNFRWKAEPENENIKLIFDLWSAKNAPNSCYLNTRPLRRSERNKNPFTSERSCYTQVSTDIDFAQIYKIGPKRIKSKAEAENLTRRLNSEIDLLLNDESIIGKNQLPNQILVRKYKY